MQLLAAFEQQCGLENEAARNWDDGQESRREFRAIVATERRKEYAEAAHAIGAGPWRILLRHLLPASTGFLVIQATTLLPAFILAEATLSFVGLGFPDTIPSWGSMLLEASDVSAIGQFPWTLAPAAAIFVVTLAANLLVEDSSSS